ncbi:MAG: hypothetical protein MJ252_06980 [archaeon]|nr:hypothetical protein [archaeon]
MTEKKEKSSVNIIGAEVALKKEAKEENNSRNTTMNSSISDSQVASSIIKE